MSDEEVDAMAQSLIPRLERIAEFVAHGELPANDDPWYSTRKRLQKDRRQKLARMRMIEEKAEPLWRMYRELAGEVDQIDEQLAGLPSPPKPGEVLS